MKDIKNTPCVGICSTVYGDQVCRGCMRFYDEVIDWNRFDYQKKESVYKRLDHITQIACEGQLAVVDGKLLRHALGQNQIPYEAWLSDLHLGYYMLRCRAEWLKDFSDVGLKNLTNLSPIRLLSQIEQTMRQLSEQAFAQQAEHA